MPDFNPDREGHQAHNQKYVVQKAQPTKETGVVTSRGELKFNDEGRLIVNDPALASEIRSENPHRYAVTRVRMPDRHDRGHRYFFGQMPEMPWKRKKEADDGNSPDSEGEERRPAGVQPAGGA